MKSSLKHNHKFVCKFHLHRMQNINATFCAFLTIYSAVEQHTTDHMLQTKPIPTFVLMQCQDSPTWGQQCRLQPAGGLDGQSVTTTNTAAVTGLLFSQLMSSQSNLSVCELPYSSCFHTHICMRTSSKKHTAHIDLQNTAKGIPFIKDLQAELCLFVCICDYGLAVSSLMPHPQRQSQNTVLCTSLFGAVL